MKRKAPLKTILGQSEIPSGEWTISRLSAKQAQAISQALRPQRVNSRPFHIYEIDYER
jgi:hypothetical protein